MRFHGSLIRNAFTIQCIQLVFLLFLPLQLMATDCSPAAIVLSSQGAVDNFQRDHGPGCDTVVETLKIDGVDIENLNGLKGLKSVSDWMQVANTSIEDLRGLENLQSVGGSFYVSANDSLTRLLGLESLESVGSLYLLSNPRLQSVLGLSSLGGQTYRLNVIDNHALTSLDGLYGLESLTGSLVIAYNDLLENVDGLSGLNSIAGAVEIESNPSMENLNGLSQLKHFGGGWIHIIYNDSLTSIDAFQQLTDLSNAGVWIGSNPQLLNIEGFTSLMDVQVIRINSNSSLERISGFSSLQTVVNLEISGLPVLVDLSGLSNLTDVDDFTLRNSDAIKDLRDFPSLSRVGFLQLRQNDGLESLEGLSSLQKVRTLSIWDCDRLTTMVGLENIELELGITLSGNESLHSLDGLEGLRVGQDFGVYLSQSPNLVDLSSLSGIARLNHLHLSDLNKVASLDSFAAVEEIADSLTISNLPTISDLSGLDSVRAVGGEMWIGSNNALRSLQGLESLESGNVFTIQDNSVLESLTGLEKLREVSGLQITDNSLLKNLDALQSLISVINSISVEHNPNLADCSGIYRLVDEVDDGEPGPGPGASGIPDIGDQLILQGNNPSCNSREAILSEQAPVISTRLEVRLIHSDENSRYEEAIAVSCEGVESITTISRTTNQHIPATFEVAWITGTPVECTAVISSANVGYTADESDCQHLELQGETTATCTIVNQQNPVSVFVEKIFVDGNTMGVSTSLRCSTGTVTAVNPVASNSVPARFTVSDFHFLHTTCNAQEVMPEGYKQESSSCGSVTVELGQNSTCTLVNTLESKYDASAITGSWYNPQTSGEGFMIHAVDDETAVAYFYGYDSNGDRLWLIGQSNGPFIPGESAEFQVVQAHDGAFTNLNADRIVRTDWGTFEFVLWDCDIALVTMIGEHGEKTLDLERLATTSGNTCLGEQVVSETDAVTGSWYEPQTSGQGFSIHKVAEDRGVVYFYGYNDQGENLWLIGVWEQEWAWGEEFVVPMLQATGGTFDEVIPDQIVREDWGTLTLRFDDCYNGWARLEGHDGMQELELTLLAGSMGLECQYSED